jgi:hypothetical protein
MNLYPHVMCINICDQSESAATSSADRFHHHSNEAPQFVVHELRGLVPFDG